MFHASLEQDLLMHFTRDVYAQTHYHMLVRFSLKETFSLLLCDYCYAENVGEIKGKAVPLS